MNANRNIVCYLDVQLRPLEKCLNNHQFEEVSVFTILLYKYKSLQDQTVTLQ